MPSSRKGPGFYGKSAAVPLPCPFPAGEEDVSVGKEQGRGAQAPRDWWGIWFWGCRGQNFKVFLPKGEGGAGAVPLEHKHVPKEEMGRKSWGEIPVNETSVVPHGLSNVTHKLHSQFWCDQEGIHREKAILGLLPTLFGK